MEIKEYSKTGDFVIVYHSVLPEDVARYELYEYHPQYSGKGSLEFVFRGFTLGEAKEIMDQLVGKREGRLLR